MGKEWREHGTTRIVAILVVALIIFSCGLAIALFLPYGKIQYVHDADAPLPPVENEIAPTSTVPVFKVTHVSTPAQVKAVYLTSWAASNDKFRKEIYDLLEHTEINSVVVDIKDYTGRISFLVEDPYLKEIGSAEKRIPDIKEFIGELHKRGAYVIGRISSFQDSFLIKSHPEWAVRTLDGGVWQDYKGVKWLDAGAEPVYNYLIAIGNQSYAYGFDELNFDYIRYPSDGDLSQAVYSWSNGRPRREVMKGFYMALREGFATTSIVISADMFGLVTSANDDLGIGQVLVDALPYFDYIAPMVYPSHFAKGYNNFAKPAEHPYDVIKISMGKAVDRAVSASTSPEKLRPWLQAFDLGAVYTPAMVRAQIQASYDLGLTSWMLWNAGSVYNKDSLLPKGKAVGSATSSTTIAN